MSHTDLFGRILALEPDPDGGAALQRVLGPHIRAALVIVSCMDEALDAITTEIPDLILTSTFLPPSDETRLRNHLRQRPETSHVQVLALPQFVETSGSEKADDTEPRKVLRFGRKRQGAGSLKCDADVLRQQVEEYLAQARDHRVGLQECQQRGILPLLADSGVGSLEHVRADSTSTALLVAAPPDPRAFTSAYRLPSDRRRAPRRRAADLDGRWGIRLPAGGDARIVDISRLGVLLETKSKLTPGRVIDLQMLGLERTLSVPAWLVRSEVTDVKGHDMTYRVAVAFSQVLDLSTRSQSSPGTAAHAPKVLGDLLGRVLTDANWVSNGMALCSRFEEELGRLMRVQEVRIRAVPIHAPSGCESLSFTIPGPGNGDVGLQAIFEPGYKPTPVDIRLLRTAANLASVVLELASAHSPIN